MVASAFLVAISIVCGKYLAIRGGDVLRFSFENLPILLAGIAFGPLVGLAAFYDMPLYALMLWRLLNYLIIGVLEYVILLVILKNKNVRAQLSRLTRSH